MVDELRLNTKFYGFDGIIGRYDYFTNMIYLAMINLVFTLPLTGFLLSHAESLLDLFNLHGLFMSSSLFLKFWVILGTLVCTYFMAGNVFRRLNDITGSVNKNRNIAAAAIFALSWLGFYFPDFIMVLIFAASTITGLFLLFKKGKITGKYPYDYRKEFNWGAFFGTWIWGLFNKSYKTLWMLPLCLTPWCGLYQLFCGAKGNEWAANNRDWQNLEEFRSSQEKQTVVFVILSFIIIPVVSFLISMGIVGTIMFTALDEAKTSPEHKSTTIEKLDSAINSFGSLYFEGHEITQSENKYYVLLEDWRGYSFTEKKDILDMAASMAASEREKQGEKYTSKTKELPRTKIYSSTDKKLLGEFYMDESTFSSDSANFKEYFKAAMKAYRFYN